MKINIRGSTISFSSFKQKQNDDTNRGKKEKGKKLQEKLHALDKQYTDNFSKAILGEKKT